MNGKPSARIPSYRLHKPKGLGVVRLNGRDIYLGKYDTPESHAEYRRVIAEWLASGASTVIASVAPACAAPSLTINELVLAYLQFAKGYYVKNGRQTGEVQNLKDAVKPLVLTHGHVPVSQFGPIALTAVRDAMVKAGLCRTVVNARVNRIRRVLKWGVARQFVPSTVLEGLRALEPLKFGRCEARETEPVRPVAAEVVETTKRAAPPTLALMIELHQLSGMRPGELVIMRGCDIERSGKAWRYTPSSHKTEHYGCTRTISLGPKAQALLLPLLKDDPKAFIFSPEKVLEERRRLSRMNRRTPITPSERVREKKQQPKRKPGRRYTVMSYARAVAYACDMAYPHPELSGLRRSRMTVEQRAELEAWRAAHRWSPNQLRHSAATAIRKKFGIEAARVVLGHSSASTTEIYAEQDASKAAEVMGLLG